MESQPLDQNQRKGMNWMRKVSPQRCACGKRRKISDGKEIKHDNKEINKEEFQNKVAVWKQNKQNNNKK